MSLDRVLALGGPLDKALMVIVAGVVTLVVMSIGQGLAWQWLDVSNAGDPVAAIGRFGSMLMWVVHPLSAVCAGTIVSLLRLSFRNALLATAVGLTPLWIVWASTGISLERAASAAVCIGVAYLPVILRNVGSFGDQRRKA